MRPDAPKLNRLSTLTDILDIAKDRNNTTLIYSTFSAATPVLQTMAAMKPFGQRKSVHFDHKIDPAAAELTVEGDERRIRHVVQNLVNNAIKFTPEGGRASVSLLAFDSLRGAREWWDEQAARFESHCWKGQVEEADDAATRWFVYSVEDTGVGVSRGDIPLLTSAYRQLSHGASKEYAGTGLGLHISNGHIRTMSGGLGIASTRAPGDEDNSGTIFAFILPLRLKSEQIGTVMDEDDSAATAPDVSGPMLFFIADDHVVNVRLLEHKIMKSFPEGSVKVVSANDGVELVEKWKNVKTKGEVVDGVFMDFHMPRMDGTECTVKLRSLEEDNGWSRTPIWGCTADPTERAIKLFNDAGGDGALFKPWKKGDVEAACGSMTKAARK